MRLVFRSGSKLGRSLFKLINKEILLGQLDKVYGVLAKFLTLVKS